MSSASSPAASCPNSLSNKKATIQDFKPESPSGHHSPSPSSPHVENDISVMSTATEPAPLSTQPTCGNHRKGPKKSVTFHTSVKTHDGLSYPSTLYLKAVRNAYGMSAEPVVHNLARKLDLSGLLLIRRKFFNLIRRCVNSKKGSAPVLNGGGGGSLSVTTKHLSFLYKQLYYQDRMIAKVENTMTKRRRAHRSKSRIRHHMNRIKQKQESEKKSA